MLAHLRHLSPRAALAGLSVLALTGSLLVTESALAACGSVCDGQSPNRVTDARTVRTLTPAQQQDLDNRIVELRYSPSLRTAWGRIRNGNVGDEVWVDRSHDGGRTYEGMLGEVSIQYGHDNHTSMWNDAGLLMRACGRIHTFGPFTETQCTGWY